MTTREAWRAEYVAYLRGQVRLSFFRLGKIVAMERAAERAPGVDRHAHVLAELVGTEYGFARRLADDAERAEERNAREAAEDRAMRERWMR